MRILFLTSEFPYPADSGVRIKTHSILQYLRRHHEVEVLCFNRRPLDDEQRAWARALGVSSVALNRGRNPLVLARSYLSGVPLSIERNYSAPMSALVSERLRAGDREAVFIDGWLMAQYVPESVRCLKLLHEHNAEHVIWRRQAESERRRLLRALVRREYERVLRFEMSILPRFDWVFAVSGADRAALIEIGAAPERTLVLPNLPDLDLLELPPLPFTESSRVILYFGTLSWQPNIEGLERLMGRVLPLVRAEVPEARLLVAGQGAPRRLAALARATPGVDFVGPVREPESLYQRARLFMEATRTGGGTKLKVLNAMARGLPVVASPEAAAGLEALSGEHLLIAADDEGLAQSVVRLMRDRELCRRLSDGARTLVKERYVAAIAFRPLDEVLSGARARA